MHSRLKRTREYTETKKKGYNIVSDVNALENLDKTDKYILNIRTTMDKIQYRGSLDAPDPSSRRNFRLTILL